MTGEMSPLFRGQGSTKPALDSKIGPRDDGITDTHLPHILNTLGILSVHFGTVL